MAKIVTVQLLVDAVSDAGVEEAIRAILESQRELYWNTDAEGNLVDFRLHGEGRNEGLYASDLDPAIEDAIVNATYQPGDAFRSPGMVLPSGKDYALGQTTPAVRGENGDSIWVAIAPAEPLSDAHEGATGAIALQLKRTHEGVIVDAYTHETPYSQALGSVAVEFADAVPAQPAVANG